MIDFSLQARTAFSISAAATEFPNRIGIVAENKSYTFRELNELTQKKIKKFTLPEVGRPYVLTGYNTFETLVTIYALFERKIPILFLHPNLTESEKEELLSLVEDIKEPLPEGTAVVLFTSGTTGIPKPAILSYTAFAASALSSASNIPLTENDRWLMSISVSRIGGLSILTRSLMARSAIVLAPHFSAETFVDVVDSKKVTLASIVPTMLTKLLADMPFWKPEKSFRTILLGGASAPEALLARARRKGIPIVTTYGMTETASNIVTTPYEERLTIDAPAKVNALAQIKIRNGTLHMKGPMRMTGYWGQEPLKEDEWFDTGDIASISEDEAVTIETRRTDLIVTGGENVYPVEVENVLTKIPAISDALVLGFPDVMWGAIVTALLVPRESPMDPEILVQELKKRLSTYKCPRRIAWVKELPLKPSGKLDRSPAVLTGLNLIPLHYTNTKAS